MNLLSRYHEFSSDDRLRDLIGANVDSTVKAMARSKAEEKSAYQAISFFHIRQLGPIYFKIK